MILSWKVSMHGKCSPLWVYDISMMVRYVCTTSTLVSTYLWLTHKFIYIYLPRLSMVWTWGSRVNFGQTLKIVFIRNNFIHIVWKKYIKYVLYLIVFNKGEIGCLDIIEHYHLLLVKKYFNSEKTSHCVTPNNKWHWIFSGMNCSGLFPKRAPPTLWCDAREWEAMSWPCYSSTMIC